MRNSSEDTYPWNNRSEDTYRWNGYNAYLCNASKGTRKDTPFVSITAAMTPGLQHTATIGEYN